MTPLRQRLARACLGAAIVVPAALLGGCGENPAPPHAPGAIALVVGGRSNMPRPQLTERAGKLVEEAVLSGDTLYIVGVSGQPQLLYTESMTRSCDSAVACAAATAERQRQVAALLTRVRATATEADTLGAVALAARSLAGTANSGPRRLIVVDNGLQTAGAIRLQTVGALAADPDALAADLRQRGYLEHLTDVDVLFTGLGSTAAPQTALSTPERWALERLWRTLLTTAGARVEVGLQPFDAIAPAADLPAVSVVSSALGLASGCVRLPVTQLGFRPDTAEFTDAVVARRVLEPIARDITARAATVTVIGTTAVPERDPTNPLSTARAQQVAALLVELGVPASAVVAVGVGTNFAGYQSPTRADGSTDAERAALNRLVIIQVVGQNC